MKLSQIFLLGLVVATQAIPFNRINGDDQLVVVEQRKVLAAPSGWSLVGPTPVDEKIELSFAIKQQNLDALLSVFDAVSDPKDPSYGKHLTNEDVHTLIAPKPAHIKLVTEWLVANGLTPAAATPNSDFITVVTTTSHAETLLDTHFQTFVHDATKQTVSRAPFTPYRLPKSIASAVDFVSPTLRFPATLKPKSTPVDNDETLSTTPSSLRELYSVGSTLGQSSKNKQAVTAFLGQHFSARDLAEFFTLFYHAGKGQTITPKGDDPTGLSSGIEAMLDAEYIIALGTNITTEFWGFSGKSTDNPNNEPFLKWLQLVSSTSDAEVPLIFSTSYGEDEDSATLAYAERLNVEFQKAGARGISLLFASGDSGAAGDDGGCSDDGKFVPQWPSGSPFVTAVGGTTGSGKESAVGLSSGGFSNRWGRPSWQSDAVDEYLKSSKLPDHSKFNSTGRGFPDISAKATGFVVVADRVPNPGVAGTSCASPTASGVFGLLNDLRLQNGKSQLGFLNPFIYQNMDKFNDITSGSGQGCDFGDGFPAIEGWDAVTGVGTPNYDALAKAVLELP